MDELDFYTKAEINAMFGVETTEDTGRDFYTKTEIIAKVGTPETSVLPADMLDFYTKSEVDSIPAITPEYSDTNKTTIILLDSDGNRTDQIQQFAPQTSNPLYGVKSFLQNNLSNKYDMVIGKDFMTGYTGGSPGVIQNYAFRNCTNLMHLEIYCTSTGDDTTFVNELGDEFCDGCTNLKSVVLPPSLRNIDFRTFAGCTALVGTMKLPNQIESIGSGAFRGCSGIQKFEIPASINFIHISAFRNCTALQEIVIDKPQDSIANAPWTWDDSAFNPANVTVTWTG